MKKKGKNWLHFTLKPIFHRRIFSGYFLPCTFAVDICDISKNPFSLHCRYLIPISLAPEALASDAIATLRDEYQLAMDDFKEAHKLYQKASKENSQFRELRGDIEIIEMEKENGRYR